MAAQKRKKLSAKNFVHFWMSIALKPVKLNLSTLLILPDQMEDC